MRIPNRLPISLLLAASAAALLSAPASMAQPQTPLEQCHLVTTCTIIPEKVIGCLLVNKQTHQCLRPDVIPAHKVCVTKKVCEDN